MSTETTNICRNVAQQAVISEIPNVAIITPLVKQRNNEAQIQSQLRQNVHQKASIVTQ